MKAIQAQSRGDQGATAIVALALLVGVGLVLASLLTYNSAAVLSAAGTKPRIDLASDAALATDATISNLAGSNYYNSPGDQQCTGPFFYPAENETIPGKTVYYATKCIPRSDSGANSSSYASADPTTANALILLGSEGRDGLIKSGNSPLYVKGGVVTNGALNFSSPLSPCSNDLNIPSATNVPPPTANCNELYVEKAGITAALASPQCDASTTSASLLNPSISTYVYTALTTANAVKCGSGGTPAVAPAGVTLPSQSLNGIPQRFPTDCTNKQQTFYEFSPGYYDDVNALNRVTSPKSSENCSGLANIYFKPGTYYFDFKNLEYNFMQQSGQDLVWKLDSPTSRATVIGGTKQDWPASTTTPIDLTKLAGCVDPTGPDPVTKAKAPGVVFVFGGESRMYVGNSSVKLCAGAPLDANPPMLLFGATAGTTPTPTPVVGKADAAPIGAGFNPLNSTVLRDRLADYTSVSLAQKNGNGINTRTLVEDAFVPDPVVPPGSMVSNGMTLSVVQKQTANLNVNYQATLTFRSAATVSPVQTLAVTTNSATIVGNVGGTAPVAPAVSADLLSALDASDQNRVYDFIRINGLGGVKVEYTLTNNNNSNSMTVDIDQIVLKLSVSPASLRSQTESIRAGQRNCVGDPGTQPSDPLCPMLESNQGSQPLLYLRGLTYATKAGFKVRVNNASGQVFGWGLVADWLDISVSASNVKKGTALGPAIEIPFATDAGADVVVYLRTYRCVMNSGGTPTAWTGETPPLNSDCNPTSSTNPPPALKAEVWIQSPVDATALGKPRKVRVASWDQRP